MLKQCLLLFITALLGQFLFGQSGTLDLSYANDAGFRTLNFLAEEELTPYSVTDSQNRTWIAGQTAIDGNWRIILSRLDAEGNYDQSFGGTGYAVINLGGNQFEFIKGIALQNDDLIITGVIVENGEFTPFLVSYTSEGSLKTDFGEFGAFVPTAVNMDVTGIQVDESRSIFLSGGIEDNVLAVKGLPDGSGFDHTFGFFGAAIADFPSVDRSVCIDFDTDGNVYVFGYGELNGVIRGHVTAFTSTGEKNSDFTANGRKSITWPDDKEFLVSDGLIHSGNQKIYLSGSTRNPDTEALNTAAVAITLAAEQDMNFGQGGWLEPDLGIGGADVSHAIVEGLNGLYLAVGIQEFPQGINSGVLHIDEDGQWVQSFGGLGLSTVNLIEVGDDYGLSISFQSDDRLILVGVGETEEIGIFGYATRLFNDISSSVNNDIFLSQLKVYPNPTTEFLQVSLTKEAPTGLPYSIFGIDGTLQLQGRLQSLQQDIDVSVLPAGQYVLQIPGHYPQQWIKMTEY